MNKRVETQFNAFMGRLVPGQIAVALFEDLPNVLFWIKDACGRFVYVNSAYCHDVAVMSIEEMIGQTDEDVFPKELARVFCRGDAEVVKTLQPIRNKPELVSNRLGQVEWRTTSKIPLIAHNGECIDTAGIARKMGRIGELFGPTKHHKMSVIVELIYRHLDQKISVLELAEAASVSVSTLERLFKEYINKTPRQFILRVKMSEACDRLLTTGQKVKEIAASLGYLDHANFTRSFTKVMGMSPRTYQNFYKSNEP